MFSFCERRVRRNCSSVSVFSSSDSSTSSMPPHAANMPTPRASNTTGADSPKSARERDLLLVIANKDKRIQRLEDKLEAQEAFIKAVLKLSECYKGVQTPQLERRVSWCHSVDEQDRERTRVKRSTSNEYEICIDDILEDDLSILSEEEDRPKYGQKPPESPKPTAESVFREFVKKPEAVMPKVQKPIMMKQQVDVEIDELEDDEPAINPKVQERQQRRAKKEESSLVQAIIAGLRDDSDSVSV